MHLTSFQNKMLFKKIIVEIIRNCARIENVNITIPQTQSIIDGAIVNGLTSDEIQTVLNLKNACKYIINNNKNFDGNLFKKINEYVAYCESIEWGVLRSGNISISGTNYVPSIPDEIYFDNFIENIDRDSIKGIIEFMYKAIKNQFFWDGNKRTCILAANQLMIEKGFGCLTIPSNLITDWNILLNDYYNSLNDKIIDWTLDNCIVTIKN